MPPEHVYVLTTPEGALELRETPRNEVIVIAFSRYSLLAASCGAGQPHARLDHAELERATSELRQTVMVGLDVWLPEGARYPEPDPREQAPLDPLHELADDGVLWIPTRPVRRGDRRVEAELHGQRPGQRLLCVYESFELLLASCGPYQAAAAIEVRSVQQIAEESGASGVAFNPVLAEEVRHTGVVQNRTRQSGSGRHGRRRRDG